MIITLLFFTLILGTLVVYFVNNKKLLSPTLILFAGFTVSSFFTVINRELFIIDISFITYLVIISSLIAWGLGDMISKSAFTKIKKPILSFEPKYKILPSNQILFISCLIVFGVAFSEYYRFINLGKSLGGDNFIIYYSLIREFVVEGQNSGVQTGEFLATKTVVLMITIAKTLTYFFIVLFFYNKYFHRVKKYRYLILILFFLPILFFTTSRTTFLELFLFIIITMVLIKSQSIGWGKDSLKILRKIVIPFLFVTVGFYTVGFIRSNGIVSEFSSNMLNSLSKYFGSSIYGLDILLERKMVQSNYFGEQTLSFLYSILGKLGFMFDKLPLHSEDFYIGNGADQSNVYTALRKPIIDFGILGMLGSRVVMGFIYGLIYRFYSNNLNNPYSIKTYVILPLLYFPLMMYVFSDLFNYFFQYSFIETLLILFLLQRLIVKKSLVFNNVS